MSERTDDADRGAHRPIRQAVLLAGGRGTRLGTLTESVPKPLLPVAGRPFLDWVVDHLVRQGVDSVIVTTGYLADAFDRWAADLRARSDAVTVHVHREDQPLDTGGALCLLGDRLEDAFYVLNGDTLFDVPLADLAGILDHPRRPRPLMALALRAVDDTGRYGSAAVTEGVLTTFAEKAGGGPGLINGGVYALRAEALRGRVAPLSIERELVPELMAEGRVTAIPCDGFFIDIGVPETYEAAQRIVPEWWGRTGSDLA